MTHTRWGIWPVCGAYAPSGGHVKVLGFLYSWVDVHIIWEFQLFGLFAIRRAYGETQWAFGKITLNFKQARWRYYECQQVSLSRRTRKKFRSALRDSQCS